MMTGEIQPSRIMSEYLDLAAEGCRFFPFVQIHGIRAKVPAR
jgi:hypothetical protein